MYIHKAVINTLLLASMLSFAPPPFAVEATLFIGELAVDDQRHETTGKETVKLDLVHIDDRFSDTAIFNRIEDISHNGNIASFTAEGYPYDALSVNEPWHLSASFLIDNDDPVFKELLLEINKQYGASPTPSDIEDFVYHYIADKNLQHGFDMAAKVAVSRSGDCTEHAVLLAALMRMFDYPARVVTGVVLSTNEAPAAYYHAWVEYYSGSRWDYLDGTKINSDKTQYYIPLSIIEDEGFSFAFSLAVSFQKSAINKIVLQ